MSNQEELKKTESTEKKKIVIKAQENKKVKKTVFTARIIQNFIYRGVKYKAGSIFKTEENVIFKHLLKTKRIIK